MSSTPWQNGGGRRTFGPTHTYDPSRENAGGGGAPTSHSSGIAYKPNSYGDILEKSKGFLGVPNTSLYNFAQHYESELDTFPDQYSDALVHLGYGSKDHPVHNRHLEQVMLEKTNSHQCYPITRCAPWEEHNTSLTIQWQSINFTQHVLDKLPELAMARLVSKTTSGGSASMARFGIAMLMEATFMTTAQGKRTFNLIIEQMKIATITTACTMILVALLTHKPYEAEGLEGVQDEESATSLAGINKILRLEKENTACMNKKNGADKMMSTMRGILSRRGVSNANFAIIPEGSSAAFGSASVHRGHIATDHSDEAVMSSVSAAMTIIESEARSQGHGTPNWDPFKRRKAYGTFFTLDSVGLEGIDPLKFKTRMMSKVVYDEDADCFRNVSVADVIKYHGHYRYDELDAPLTSQSNELGYGYVRDLAVYTWGQANRKFMLPFWSKNLVDIILARGDTPQKRRAFMASVRLLPKDCPEVDFAGDYPDEDTFDMQKVIDVCGGYAQMDTTFTVNDFREVQTGRADMLSERTSQIRRLANKREREEMPLTAEELFEMNDDDDQRKKMTPFKQRESFEVDGDLVMKTHSFEREARVIRRKFRTKRPRDIEVVIKKELEDARTKLLDDSQLQSYLGVWPKAIDSAPQLNDEMRLHAYRDLKTCAQNAVAYITWVRTQNGATPEMVAASADQQKDAIKTCVDILMGRACGMYDVDCAVKTNVTDRNQQTPLEQQSLDEGNLASKPSADALKYLKWNVIDPEDEGQVFLMDRLHTVDMRRSLPADAYAASLAAPGRVAIFTTDSSPDEKLLDLLVKQLPGRAHAGRRAALQWSLFVSRTLRVVQDTPPDNAEEFVDLIALWLQELIVANSDQPDVAAYKKKTRNALLTYAQNHAAKCVLPLSQASLAPMVKRLQLAIAAALKHADANASSAAPVPLDAEDESVINRALLAIKRTLALTAADQPFIDTLRTLQLGDVKEAVKEAHAKDPNVQDKEMPQAPHIWETNWTYEFVDDIVNRASIAFGGFALWCVYNDVPIFADPYVDRPCKIYTMSSALMMVADGRKGAAVTFFQMPHMMTGADPGPKLFYGNYTVYFAPVVMNPERLVVMPDVFVSDYHGGNDLTLNDPNNPDHVAAWSSGKGASCFVLMIPQRDRNRFTHKWMSITGVLPPTLPADLDVQERIRFPGCDSFARFWGFTGTAIMQDDKAHVTNISLRELRQNVLCFQDFQVGYDPSTDAFTKYTLNEGHFGKYACYPGAAEVTHGRIPHFEEKPSYYDASSGI